MNDCTSYNGMAASPARRHWLDNLRWVTVLLVLAYHVIYFFNNKGVFGGIGGFGDGPQYQDVVMYILYPWFMPLLFLLAGISARYALERRTGKEWFRSRTLKLLVPSTIGLLVFHWMEGYFNTKVGGVDVLAALPQPARFFMWAISGCGPLWFLQDLWLFSLILLAVRRLDRKDKFFDSCGRMGLGAVILLGILFWVGEHTLIPAPRPESADGLYNLYKPLFYLIPFLLGYFVFSHDRIQEALGKAWIPLMACAVITGTILTATTFGEDNTTPAYLGSPLNCIYGWLMCLAMTGLFKAVFDRTGRFASYMARSSFGIYVVHYLVIVSLGYMMKTYTALHPAAIYCILTAAVFIISPLLYETIRRIPVVRWCVLGYRKAKDNNRQMIMKRSIICFLSVLSVISGPRALAQYIPSEGNLEARKEFSEKRLGIFIHWGIYSNFGMNEWFLSTKKVNAANYTCAADSFYPSKFNAEEWAAAFKDAGAGYVTLTSRHHDGFSMYGTKMSKFNIVDGTPFGRDVLAELTDAVKRSGLKMQYYYSLIDWIRPDYPKGKSGIDKDASQADYDHYFEFEKGQIKELMALKPRALWFDGLWDKPEEPNFNWRMDELYALIHSIDPDCLIGNNHHSLPLPGEDIQMFEQDLPGENDHGFSGQGISSLPLEACITMNGSWGYRADDNRYKSVKELITLIVRAASKGANVLLNVGPDPSGRIPEAALARLKAIGEWMRENGHTVNGCGITGIPPQNWGVSTGNETHVYLHVLSPEVLVSDGSTAVITIPFAKKVKSVTLGGEKLEWKKIHGDYLVIKLPVPDRKVLDTIIDLSL